MMRIDTSVILADEQMIVAASNLALALVNNLAIPSGAAARSS
jgi:hypothetical protein